MKIHAFGKIFVIEDEEELKDWLYANADEIRAAANN